VRNGPGTSAALCVRIFPIESENDARSECHRRRHGSATSGGVRAEGESPPKIALVRVFSRDPIRGGLTNRGKPRYSSSRRYRCSLYPIPFPLSRDNVRNRAVCEKLPFGQLPPACRKYIYTFAEKHIKITIFTKIKIYLQIYIYIYIYIFTELSRNKDNNCKID